MIAKCHMHKTVFIAMSSVMSTRLTWQNVNFFDIRWNIFVNKLTMFLKAEHFFFDIDQTWVQPVLWKGFLEIDHELNFLETVGKPPRVLLYKVNKTMVKWFNNFLPSECRKFSPIYRRMKGLKRQITKLMPKHQFITAEIENWKQLILNNKCISLYIKPCTIKNWHFGETFWKSISLWPFGISRWPLH